MPVAFDASEFTRRIAELEKRLAGAGRRALLEAAEQLVGDAQQLCPVKTGTLQASGTVDDSQLAAKGEVTLGFNTPYAAAVHERTDVSHGQGQAKYLETAIKAGLPRITEILGREIAGAVG